MRGLYLFLLVMCVNGAAIAAPPLEAYGSLPNVDRMAISPDGEHLAYILRGDGAEGLFIFNPQKGITGGAKIEKGKVRSVYFAGDKHVILQATMASKGDVYAKYEASTSGAYNIVTNELTTLDRGRIIGLHKGHEEVFSSSFNWDGYHRVYRVDLNNGRATEHIEAGKGVWDWFIDTDGTPIAREDYSFGGGLDYYTIRTMRNGEWEAVFAERVEKPPFTVIGVKPDKSALLAYDDPIDSVPQSLFEMSFNGSRSEPIFARSDAGIGAVVSDVNRFVFGVQHTGLYPEYEFYDQSLTNEISTAQSKFPGASVKLVDWTKNLSKLLLHVAGAHRAPAYYLYDRATNATLKIANAYDDIEDADIGEILTIEYASRDGLKIPAILTMPASVNELDNLPMIVMPHGGPESYDAVGFNWKAQYFASRGYLVFQPNFRGSGGFGEAFRIAGHGEWGGKMQDDLTDGVRLLIKKGWADADRVCIVGASYGGYAALAGGAFTPELYKCVAAIAPIGDVKMMLRDIRRRSSSRSFWYEYWETLVGDLRDDSEKLELISPINHAANFKAPVLILHGEDDAVVPITQSRKMAEALTEAGKDVRLVELKGEDHWLSQSETRLQALKALSEFVERNIGPGANAPPPASAD